MILNVQFVKKSVQSKHGFTQQLELLSADIYNFYTI